MDTEQDESATTLVVRDRLHSKMHVVKYLTITGPLPHVASLRRIDGQVRKAGEGRVPTMEETGCVCVCVRIGGRGNPPLFPSVSIMIAREILSTQIC